MSKILITGSEGFIGKHLCEFIQKSKPELTIIQVDLKNNQDLKDPQFVDNLPDVDYVVHLAAYNGTTNFYEFPFDVVSDNVLSTHYLIRRYFGKVKKFIFSSTCETYAGAVDYFGYKVPTDEKVPLVIDDVTNPRWSYAASKLLNEVALFSAMKQLTQDILILRYHNIYGPGQIEHFIPDYINRALNGEYRIYGYENTRSFLFIDDAIKITSQLIFSNAKNLVINVGSEEEMTILSVARTINKILKVNNEIQLIDPPKGSVSRRKPDLTLLRSIIGDFNFTSLVDGLKVTVKSATNKS